jgi:hypothetical protein
LPTTTDTLVGKTTTDTLTNKTLTSPVIAGTPTGVGVLTAGTAVTASGTSVDFTSIPSWVKRITVMFNGVSTNGTSIVLIQLGDSGGIENTGYLGGGVNNSGGTITNFTTGFGLSPLNEASSIGHGLLTITSLNGNTWVANGIFARSSGPVFGSTAGAKTLSATLDRVRITTVNGTDAFDAGSINILFE